jgi:hypothetical protein
MNPEMYREFVSINAKILILTMGNNTSDPEGVVKFLNLTKQICSLL